MNRPAQVQGKSAQALLDIGKFFTRWDETEDRRAVFRDGGRAGDVFYRDRWSHDKIVRSTHGVNCTGSCSWKVYVKDGIITWETQETDYPSVGPDRPEYEPRGCPRGAAFSWYTYSPPGCATHMRAVSSWRCTGRPKRNSATPSWPGPTSPPTHRRRSYQRARGKGGLVRVSWAEAIEMAAAAHVHTIKTYGPDRCTGFSPIPAMSMVSTCVGTRFIQLIGGVMTSFYDWYADLPVASPQVFGDQTDVPESGDWWDATYLMMWGSNVPVTRTPDAHWMAEVRYRGTKVVTVSPTTPTTPSSPTNGCPPRPAPTGHWPWRWATSSSKSSSSTRRPPSSSTTSASSPTCPSSSSSTSRPDGQETLVPGKFVTADQVGMGLGDDDDAWKPVFLDDGNGAVVVPTGRSGSAMPKPVEGNGISTCRASRLGCRSMTTPRRRR